jgi:DNA-binding transcriptional LysR family regulator
MNLGQLRYFVALSEAGSFTRAAALMRVAQPSLSQQIRALEAELGGELVERHARGIRLTEAGHAFLPEAHEAIRAVERAREAAREALELTPRRIDIVTVRSLAMTVLPRSIQQWYRTHPEFVIRLREFSDSRSAERAVAEGAGLLGIGPMPQTWSGRLRSLGWDDLVAIVPANEPGDPAQPIRLDSLADRGWVLYESHHGLRAMIDAACAQYGFAPQPVAETGQIETAARLAAAGLGPSLVPSHTVPADLAGSVRRLQPPIMWEVAAFARSGWPRFVDAYLDTLGDSPLNRQPPRDVLRLNPSAHPPLQGV